MTSHDRNMEQWLAARRDGELAPEEEALLDAHLADCPDCAAHDKAAGELSALLRRAPRHRAPAGLADRVRAALPDDESVSDRAVPARSNVLPFRAPRRWVLSVTAAAACLLLAWNIALQYEQPGASPFAEQVVDDHVRSLMANHLTDVASSDQHTVKPWFSGRLDLAPPVVDFADRGFALVGGRLDYLAGRAVAALVYRHNEHLINLFVVPDAGADQAPRHLTVRGYALLHWRKGGLGYWAVSDINPPELDTLAALVNTTEAPQQPE